MADFEELSFVIPGHTPETMPLNRLLEYLQQMTAVLGDPDKLHLIEVREGSCEPVLHTDVATALTVRDRAARVARGDGTKRQIDGLNNIRRMLRRDGVRRRPALLRSQQVIYLQIEAAPDETELTGIRQSGAVDGALIKIGGAGENALIQLQDIDGKIISGFTAKRSVAKDLAQHLWDPVRLFGVGQWGRNDEGSWVLEKMQVQSFEVLEDDPWQSRLESSERSMLFGQKTASSVYSASGTGTSERCFRQHDAKHPAQSERGAPKDSGTETPVDLAKERAEGVVQELERAHRKIILPAPACAELLTAIGADAQQYLNIVGRSRLFEVAPFDALSAAELAILNRGVFAAADERNRAEPYQKRKVDRQIIAICKVKGVTDLYTDDKGLSDLARLCGMNPIPLIDCPVPDGARQMPLTGLEPHDPIPEGERDDDEAPE